MVVATFLTPPLNFDQYDHTRPPLRYYGSIFIACFGYDAAISGEMICRHHRHGKTIHCWVVAATFLTPPLDFYQINHTEPFLRHHGLIYDIRFWPDAANSSEMSRRRHTEHERRTWFLKFGEVLAGGATISD